MVNMGLTPAMLLMALGDLRRRSKGILVICHLCGTHCKILSQDACISAGSPTVRGPFTRAVDLQAANVTTGLFYTTDEI